MNARLEGIKELPTHAKGAGEAAVRVLRDQARRPDRVGELTHRTWELVHEWVGVAARSLTRLERVTQPPARAMRRSQPSHQAASSRPTEQAHRAQSHSTQSHSTNQ